MDPPATQDGTNEWRIATSSIVKILVTLLLVVIGIRLWPLCLLVAIAILAAVTLFPIVDWFCERGLPHWLAVCTVALVLISSFALFVIGILPVLSEQVATLLQKLPEIQAEVLRWVPHGAANRALKRMFSDPGVSATHVLSVGQVVAVAITELVLIIVLAVYLVGDGRRTYRWLLAFFSERHREKIDLTAQEASGIIFSYVSGQVITSLLCFAYAFAVLKLLDVPAALTLAVMAAVFDVLPMLGFFLFMIPAVIVAWTVSSATGLTLFGAYTAYHLFENYFIVPKVYGKRLRLSDLVVLVSVLAGGILAGIPGAILILPLVAIYPAIERIWLVDYIGRRVVAKHAATEKSPPG